MDMESGITRSKGSIGRRGRETGEILGHVHMRVCRVKEGMW